MRADDAAQELRRGELTLIASGEDEMPNFICLGQASVAGCGAILTDEERYYYGNACETCTRKWGDAIDDWRRGGENKELDAMFDAKLSAFQ